MSFNIMLIGNQNSGKTTLFNQLTGSNQHVGSFPGTTVEQKSGTLKKFKNAVIVDLPGIYSLSPYSSEEEITRDYLLNKDPDAIINIVDATNIERNLYLSLQIIELNHPTVIALNMMDELHAAGGDVDIKGLERALGVPIVPISAMKKQGVDALAKKVMEVIEEKTLPRKMDFCSGATHKAIHAIAHIAEENANAAKLPVRFSATKLVEGDKVITRRLQMKESDLKIVEILVKEMEDTLGTDRDAALADMRYAFIEKTCCPFIHHQGLSKPQRRSIAIDHLLTHRILALPIFVAIMGMVFWLTFGVLGPLCNDWMAAMVAKLTAAAKAMLIAHEVNDIVISLVINGAFAGVGAIMSFLPTIIILFFFLALLEDSGYMSRVAFVFDRFLSKLGLSGRSFVPMLIGFGCSVPAIMATRTLGNRRDKFLTIMLVPFMSCSAKLPIYAVFTMAFFPNNAGAVMIFLYLFGIAMGILYAIFLSKRVFKSPPLPFVMEMPAYRLPSIKSMAMNLWEKAWDFISRAFTVIFLASMVIWFLQNFSFTLHVVKESQSMLATLGKFVAPIFAPLGFGDWQSVTALVTGLMSKETVISTFSVLLGAGDSTALAAALPALFTPHTAFSFLIFTLLYAPCIASFAVTKREMGSLAKAGATFGIQTVIAWVCAFVVYHLSGFLF